jgi:hypothetical protein
MEVEIHGIFTVALDLHLVFLSLAALRPVKAPGTHWEGGRVGPRTSLDVVTKRQTPALCQKNSFYRLHYHKVSWINFGIGVTVKFVFIKRQWTLILLHFRRQLFQTSYAD